MPSPVGHFLGGAIAGLMFSRRSTVVSRPSASRESPQPSALSLQPGAERSPSWKWILAFGVLGLAPDLDFLFGTHSTYSHSIGAAVIVGVGAAVVLKTKRVPVWLGPACAAAYGSHILLDWLGTDSVAPIGVMALWPFTEQHFHAGLRWFMSIERGDFLAPTWIHNARAAARELLILGPIAALVVWWARKQ